MGNGFQYPGYKKYDATRLSVIFGGFLMIEMQSDRFQATVFQQSGGSQGRKKQNIRNHPSSSNSDLQQEVCEEANNALADYRNGNQHCIRIVHAAFRVAGPLG
jgi:hypothetical protein